MPNYTRRGAQAVEEMHAKGFLTGREMAEKLGISFAILKSHRERGRIDGAVHHKVANLWFYAADTKVKEKPERGIAAARQPDFPQQVILGSWATWPAPGFVRMGGRHYQLWGGKSLGWFGG